MKIDMRRAVIIGAGPMHDYEYIKGLLRPLDTIICADGGQRHARELGVVPDTVIGDFDSSAEPKGDMRILRYPTDKDFTDMELAVRYANECGKFSKILMLGALGGRLDHTLTNISLQFESGIECVIADEENNVIPLRRHFEIRHGAGVPLAIVPVRGDITDVRTSGLKWNLDSETLYFGKGRGCSNVITDDMCVIDCAECTGVVIIGHGCEGMDYGS